MRVLHLTTGTGWRGGEQQALWLMQGLTARGVATALLAPRGSALAARARDAGLDVTEGPVRGGLDPVGAWHLRRAVRRGAHDLVHAHTARAHGLMLLALVATPHRRRPRLVVSRRVDFSIWRHGLLGLNRWKYRLAADRVICVSQAVRDVLVADGLDAGRLVVVHDGIDPRRVQGAGDPRAALAREIGVPPGARVVGNVAALVGHKGQRTLVEAVPAMLAGAPDLHVVLAGEGPLAGDLGALARRLGVAPRVHRLGHRDDVPDLLRWFDVFVFPSHEEGLGSSVLDAMAAGTPVVATTAGGLPEAITDRVEGLLVPPRDPRALAAAVLEVLADPDAARHRARAASRRVEAEFTAARMAEATLAVYREVLDAAPRRVTPGRAPGSPTPGR